MNSYDIFLDEEVDFNDSKFKRFLRCDPIVKVFENNFIGKRKGFMGLSSDPIKLIWLVKCLKKYDVRVYVTQSEIRKELDELLLLKSAENEFLERKQNYPNYEFSATQRMPLSGALAIRAVGFTQFSKNMEEEGLAPPGIFLYVDKYDAHVLNSEELLEVEILDSLTDS